MDDPSAAGYPCGWDALPLLAEMLDAGFPIRCVSLTAPGAYDTHANQPKALADGLKLTADSLLAFQRDLERRGLADRVLVHVWSEFGRRAKENGSLGTDHGAAGIGFLIGTRTPPARWSASSPASRTASTTTATCKATSDFRGIYSGAARAVARHRRGRDHPEREVVRAAPRWSSNDRAAPARASLRELRHRLADQLDALLGALALERGLHHLLDLRRGVAVFALGVIAVDSPNTPSRPSALLLPPGCFTTPSSDLRGKVRDAEPG